MDRDGVLASRIAATHGLTVESIEELRGLGSVNHTFIGRGKERCVIWARQELIRPTSI